MSPELTLTLVLGLAILLAFSSATAGALWFRLRSQPLYHTAQLARELADRQRILEDLIERLDARLGSLHTSATRPTHPVGPARIDPAHAVPPAPSPTLIAVPDLSSPAPASLPAASSELALRFGSIWKLAEEGAAPEAIARLTGQSIGQIELILGLRRQVSSRPIRT